MRHYDEMGMNELGGIGDDARTNVRVRKPWSHRNGATHTRTTMEVRGAMNTGHRS